MSKKILFLVKDTRTGNGYDQVVGKTWKKLSIGDFIDIKVDLEDNQQEWVLAKVIAKTNNVYSIIIIGKRELNA